MNKDSLFASIQTLERTDRLLRVFEDIHNHIYANDGLSQQEALEEIIKILFIKIYDEKEKKYNFTISTKEYTNIIDGKKDLSFLDRFTKLKNLTFNYFSALFGQEEQISLKPTSLAFIVNKLQRIDLLNSSNDIKGLAFQKFIHSSIRTGRGQFFTPEAVVKLCVDMIQPKRSDKVLDPACGSGGFLTHVIRHVLRKENLERKDILGFANQNIFGIEISKYAARISKMMMILEGDGFSNIVQYDSLSDWSQLNYEINKFSNRNHKNYEEYFDVILTNPPFGTQGRIENKSILKEYDLGYKWIYENDKWNKTNDILKGQVPDILFLERCIRFIKPGGRIAIVLPNGNLENKSLGYVRQYIMKHTRVMAVVKLPQETFIPAGTGVKTSILFLQKKDGTEPGQAKVFFGEVKKLGYIGNKNGSVSYKKDMVGNILKNDAGKPVIDEDISEVVQKYRQFASSNYMYLEKEDNKRCFLVEIEEINSRLDYEFYKPVYRNIEKMLTERGALKLSKIVTIKKNKSPKLRQKDSLVNYIELSDISVQYNEIINYTKLRVHDLPSRASYEVNKGDIITAVAGNSIGTRKHASAIVDDKYDGAVCTNGFRVLIPNSKKIDSFYLLYFLKTPLFLKQVYRYRTGAAIPALSDADLSEILVLVPPIKEQNRIGMVIKKGFEERVKYKRKINEVLAEFNKNMR